MSMNRIIVDLQRSGSGANNSKTSAKTTLNKTISKTTQKSSLDKKLKDTASAIRFGANADKSSISTSLLGKAGGMGALVVAGIMITKKVSFTYLDYTSAVSGDTIAQGNIKRTVERVLNPSRFIGDALDVVLSREPQIRRQNTVNEYYKDLSGNFYSGLQYGKEKQ